LTNSIQINQLIDHLFRRESGKIISVLTGVFGSENIQLAEDVVQDALTEAITQWTYNGIPGNPNAWLYKVAKNKALNILNREKYKRKYSFEVSKFSKLEELAFDSPLDEHVIKDDQLRMMFVCCHPALSPDSQIAFILKTLCGFSIKEIANAFLSNEESIHKRLVRARQKIRENKIHFELPATSELQNRIETVLQAIYLLFNEGYSASAGENVIRYELCQESIHLAEIIESSTVVKDKSNVHALLSLMLFNASRFHARQDELGNILTMSNQDRSKWNKSLIEKGFYYLQKIKSSSGVSSYHILAAISAHHCAAPEFNSTNWKEILSLYDSLLLIDQSSVVLLNRSVALSKVHGANAALNELNKFAGDEFLQSYYLYHATKAELYTELNRFREAADSFQIALQLAPIKAEKELLQKKFLHCREKV